MSKYTNRIPIEDWRNKLWEINERINKEYSIVYRFYSSVNGHVRYVGRSDSPFSRESGHFNRLGLFKKHKRLKIQVSYVDFCRFKGRGRERKSYEGECRQYHHHNPDGNSRHPNRLTYSWGCPVRGCKYH